jgi:hypothetical protein
MLILPNLYSMPRRNEYRIILGYKSGIARSILAAGVPQPFLLQSRSKVVLRFFRRVAGTRCNDGVVCIDRAMKADAFLQGIQGVFAYFMSVFLDWEFELRQIE